MAVRPLRSILLISAAALCGLGAFLLWQQYSAIDTPQPVDLLDDDDRTRIDEAIDDDTNSSEQSAEGDATRVERARDDDDEVLRVTRRVRVVNARTRTPIVGALVRVTARNRVEEAFERRIDTDAHFEQKPEPYCYFDYCAQHGTEHRTDAQGELTLVQDLEGDGSLDLVIEHGNATASTSFDAEEDNENEDSEDPETRAKDSRETVRIVAVSPSTDHRIQILDAQRNPAPDVPLDIYLLKRADVEAYDDPVVYDEDADVRRREVSPYMLARSDRDGVLRIRLPGRIVEEYESENADTEPEEKLAAFFVIPRIPFRRPPVLRLPLRGGSKVQRFILPPTGPLEFRVLRPDGTPVHLPTEGTLQREDDEFEHGRLTFEIDEPIYAKKEFGADARLRFPRVGLGTKLFVAGMLEYQGYGADEEIRGPATVRGDLKRVLRFPRFYSFFDARVESATSSVVPEVRLVMEDASKIYLNGRFKPCPDGVLRFVANLRRTQSTHTNITICDARDAMHAKTLTGLGVAASRSHDLGTLHLAKQDRWLEGTVENSQGQPLAGATVQLVRRIVSTRKKRTSTHHARIWGLKAKTDARGRYRIPYLPLVGDVFLQGSMRLHDTFYARVTGPGEVPLVLPRLCPLTVEWKNVPKAVSYIHFTATHSERKPWQQRRNPSYKVRARKGRGRRTVRPLVAGRWELTCTGTKLVGRITQVVHLREGEQRKVVFDYTNLHRYRFQVVDEAGKPRNARPFVGFRDADERNYKATKMHWSRGALEFYSTEPRIGLDFIVPARATLTREWTSGEHTLRFAGPRRFEIVFEPATAFDEKTRWFVEALPIYPPSIPSYRKDYRKRSEQSVRRIRSASTLVELGAPFPYELFLRSTNRSRRIPLRDLVGTLVGGPDPSKTHRELKIRLDANLRAKMARVRR